MLKNAAFYNFICEIFAKLELAVFRDFLTSRNFLPLKFSECGKCFALNDYLNCHLRTHTGEKLFKCQNVGNYLLKEIV